MLRQATFGFVLIVAGLAGLGLWIYLRDEVGFEQARLETVRTLTGEAARIREALADVEKRLEGLRGELERQGQRQAEADRLIAELEGQNSGLRRLTTSADQIRLNDERLGRLRQLREEARLAAEQLQTALTRGQWERDGLRIALGRSERQLAEVEARKSQVLHYGREAWARYGLQVALAVAIWFIGPPLGRLVAYFLVAPFISSRAAVRLGAPQPVLPAMVASRTSLDVELEPGDALWVQERYLQSSDEALLRRTRWLLDWRLPFTCLAAGLRELVELRNAAPAARQRVTLASQQAAHVELALLDVPAGASVILRPSFLAGLVGPLGRKEAVIRRHWRFFSLQAWATGQFRFFEFVGPCRLLLAGSRGVRAEVLEWEPGHAVPGRRANADATIGFTPGLAYRPVRAETFWTYFRGQNPLFDDLFEGRGVFLCQQTSAPGEAARQRGTMANLRNGLLRIFGL